MAHSEIKIAQKRHSYIFVTGTDQVAVAKGALPLGTKYERAITGWFMRVDGRYLFNSEKRVSGAIQGVEFVGCTA